VFAAYDETIAKTYNRGINILDERMAISNEKSYLDEHLIEEVMVPLNLAIFQ